MDLNITKNICRACLTEEGTFQSVFLKENCSGLSMHISEMLCACATIQVNEDDGLPDQLCSECSELTVKMYLFKLRCEKSDIILRERLEKSQTEAAIIKNECDDIFINKNLIEDFIDNFKCQTDEELWEKNNKKIFYEDLNEESKIKEFESKIFQENFNQNDLLTSQEIVDDIKVRRPEIIDEDIKIKSNSIGPLISDRKECVFPCPECDFVFVDKKNLDAHISDLHIKKEPEMSCDENSGKEQRLIEINSFIENEPQGCDICLKGFSLKSELKEHMKSHSSTSKQTAEQPTSSFAVCTKEFVKRYECDVCKRQFRDSGKLKRHIKLHTGEKPYKCEICQKEFRELVDLKRHQRIHTGEKPYECDICKKRFGYRNTLENHKRIHKDEKPFECEICSEKYFNYSSLICHQRLHTGEKLFECDICKKTFYSMGNLNKHKKIHTGEKIYYECDICKKTFNEKGNLKKHKIIHTNEKPFECDVCKKGFTQMAALRRHKTIHGVH